MTTMSLFESNMTATMFFSLSSKPSGRISLGRLQTFHVASLRRPAFGGSSASNFLCSGTYRRKKNMLQERNSNNAVTQMAMPAILDGIPPIRSSSHNKRGCCIMKSSSIALANKAVIVGSCGPPFFAGVSCCVRDATRSGCHVAC